MKARLLKKLRRQGRSKVDLISVKRNNNNYITGVSYYRDGAAYSGLSYYVCWTKYKCFYETEKRLKEEAAKIYVRIWLKAYGDSYRRKNPKIRQKSI